MRDCVPADVILACGIFGNVSDADIERTVQNISALCAPGAAIIWTRHRREPDMNVQIRQWLVRGGFEISSFDAVDNSTLSGVGTARLTRAPKPLTPSFRFFTFIR